MSRFLAFLLAVALLAVPLAPPAAHADNTRAFTAGAQVMSTAADILGAIDPSEATLKRFGTGLGSAVLGITIGEAISEVYGGQVAKGLETFTWAVGETAVGLTALGPFYALGKLAAAGSGWAVDKFYAYMTDDYYAQYKKLRLDSLWPLIEQPGRDQFVAWAKGGRGTFEGQWSVMWADKFARDRFIDQYREEFRSQYSWTERTIGFRLFSAFSQRAGGYFKVMNEVPAESVLKEFIWRRWEAQVVTEGLQEAAQRIRALQAERNRGLFLVLTGRATDPEGKPIPADRVSVQALNSYTLFQPLGALAPAALQDPERFALGSSLDYLTGFDPKSTLTLLGGGQVLSRFTLGSVMKASVPVVREGGVSYLLIDLGSLQARRAETRLQGQVRLRGTAIPAEQVKVKAVDPRVTQAGTDLSGPLAAVGNSSVRLILEVWDAVASAYRDVAVTVTVPEAPGVIPLDVDVPVPEVTEAAGLEAATAALEQNYRLLLDGQITKAIYRRAQGRLTSAYPGLTTLAAQYDAQVSAMVDQELQYLRVQGEYYTDRSADLKAKAAAVADGVTDPLFALVESDDLSFRSGKVDRYQQLRSQYSAMLEQAAQYQRQAEALQDEYNRALASTHFELVQDTLRGFAPIDYPPETNQFMANVRMIGVTLRPYLEQKDSGYLAECDKRAARYTAMTDFLQARAAVMNERVNASRARVAGARAIAAAAIAQRDRRLFELTGGWGTLTGTMAGILEERRKLKAGEPANTEWLTHYENRLTEFYARASQMLEQMYPLLGAKVEPVFPADTFEGALERVQPWLDYEAREWARLAPVRDLTAAMSDAMVGEATGLDFPLAGDDMWADYRNAFTPAEREQIRTEGEELFSLLARAGEGITDPASEAAIIDRWVAHLKESGYELKTATSASGGLAVPQSGTITFQVDSRIAWVNGQRVEMAAPVPLVGGRAMVPVRLIGEAMGASVTWNPQYQEVMYIKGTLTVALRVGDSLVRVEGAGRSERIFVEPAPMIIEGRTYVPVRVVAEALGATVRWVAETREIVITAP
ncbi:MAG TPA: stalk domain-containing protein [Symbiobacteriaceae bacterium]|nr:stalk domain-containing protein [Symbiobacteriaceae bacterium]